jgi:transcriptional antiterminator RfaH
MHSKSRETETSKAWYLLFSKPAQEHLAEENLRRQGYHVFVPTTTARRRRRGGYAWIKEALFPRYLFVRLSARADNWAPLRSTRGVSHIVRFGERAARVPEALVERLQRQAALATPPAATAAAQPLAVGEHVRVAAGVARDYEGLIIARTASERVLLLLKTAAGYTARVDISETVLERAG